MIGFADVEMLDIEVKRVEVCGKNSKIRQSQFIEPNEINFEYPLIIKSQLFVVSLPKEKHIIQ